LSYKEERVRAYGWVRRVQQKSHSGEGGEKKKRNTSENSERQACIPKQRSYLKTVKIWRKGRNKNCTKGKRPPHGVGREVKFTPVTIKRKQVERDMEKQGGDFEKERKKRIDARSAQLYYHNFKTGRGKDEPEESY